MATLISVALFHKSFNSSCSVTLSAAELSERKLDVKVTTSADIRNGSGEKYEFDTVRYFCGEGLSHARRRLGLLGGIAVDIKSLSGTLQAGSEVGVSLAVAVAIAKALGIDDQQSLLEKHGEWAATTMRI